MDKPTAMDHPGSAVVSCIIGHASGMLRRLDWLAQAGMIAFCAPKHRVQSVMVPRRDVRRIGTQAVCGADERAVRRVLAPCDDKPCGGMACTSIFVRPIVWPDRCRHQGHHRTPVGMEERCAQPRMPLRDRTVTMHRVHTRGTVHGRGGKIPRASEGQEGVALAKPPLVKRLATLALSKDALAHWAEPLG